MERAQSPHYHWAVAHPATAARGRSEPELWLLLAVVAVFIALYVFLDLNKLYALRFGVDTGAFLQSLINFAHNGSTFNWVERRPHLAVHDSWVLLALVPLVMRWPRPETLIVVQVVAVAAAAIPLYLFARGAGLAPRYALYLGLAYLISPSVQGWAYWNFSENHFVPILAFSLACAVQRRSFWGSLLCAQLLMGVKEDEIWFLGWFAIAAYVWYDRRLGTAVAVLALINGVTYYGVERVLGYAPSAPAYGLHDREWPQQLAFLTEVLAPFAFAPLALGWRVLLAAPLIAQITLNGPWAYPMARAGTEWTEPLVALIAIGAALAMARRPLFAPAALVCAVIMTLLFNTTVLHFGRHLFPPETAAYERAREIGASTAHVTYSAENEGAFVVASGNPNAILVGRNRPMRHPRPAWITGSTSEK
ncbi:MAG: DUF2079 domain-containing protein [Vulcanimicrobiaceae bacterium]